MTDRHLETEAFLKNYGWSGAARKVLAGDASNRRYDRLTYPDGRSALLMDAPTDKGEDVRPFQQIAAYLLSIGLRAPQVFHADTDKGFLLIEDLGDALFARLLAQNPQLEPTLYDAAIDVLAHLHRHEPPRLAPYNADAMAPLAALAFDWYQLGTTGQVDHAARDAFKAAMHAALSPLDNRPQVLIQRDYHAENLIWLPERAGVARVGLLDFQDAMLGHPAYDLVSVLQDARRDVSPELANTMIDHFLDKTAHDRDEFTAAYAVLGAQRNMRILGVFARLCMRDGKAHYVDLIPRVWGHIQSNLTHPALAEVSGFIASNLPTPTDDLLEKLKRQCANHQTP